MKHNIKYLYFEIYSQDGPYPVKNIIQNENILLFKPHTNSSSIWGFLNITENKSKSNTSFTHVHQYWIDFTKYKFDKHSVYKELDMNVLKCLEKLNKKLRIYKIKKIIN